MKDPLCSCGEAKSNQVAQPSAKKSLQTGRLETSTPKRETCGFKAAKRRSCLDDSDIINFGASGSNNKTYNDSEIENK